MKRNRLVILIGLIVFALLMGWEWRRSENWKENGSPAPEATAPAEKPSPPAATAPFRITGTQLDRNAAENFQLEVKSSGYAGRYSMVAELIHQEGTEIKTDVIAKEEGVLNHDGDPIRYLIPEERVMGPLMGAKERGKYTSYQVRIRLRALDLPSSPNPRKSEATALHVIYPFWEIINEKENTVNADQLRSLQAPLKERYKEKPEAALVTLKAAGNLADGITCRVQTGKALVEAGLHPATGGSGQNICSGDMLLEALVACAGVTMNAVATAIGVEIRKGTVRAEGDLDFRGTLGVVKEVPVGFQRIRLYFDLDTSATEEQLTTLLRLTERYCVVFQTLRHPPEFSVSRNPTAATPKTS